MATTREKKILPGIKSIFIAPVGGVSINQKFDRTNTVITSGNFVELPVAGLCSMEEAPEVVKGQLLYVYTVKGTLYDVTNFAYHRWNYLPVIARIEDISGLALLIGTNEKPFATCFIGLSVEDVSSGKRSRSFQIKFTSPNPLPLCV